MGRGRWVSMELADGQWLPVLELPESTLPFPGAALSVELTTEHEQLMVGIGVAVQSIVLKPCRVRMAARAEVTSYSWYGGRGSASFRVICRVGLAGNELRDPTPVDLEDEITSMVAGQLGSQMDWRLNEPSLSDALDRYASTMRMPLSLSTRLFRTADPTERLRIVAPFVRSVEAGPPEPMRANPWAVSQKQSNAGLREARVRKLQVRIRESGAYSPAEFERVSSRLDRLVVERDEGTFGTVVSLMERMGWEATRRPRLHLAELESDLDRVHYGHAPVKRRLVEHAAVLSRARDAGKAPSTPALLLVGPPGTGKTTLGAVVATALGIPHQVIRLGGTSDSLGLRGVSSAYRYGRPGAIAQALADAQSLDMLIVLDEVEKTGTSDQHGTAEQALLGLLDRSASADDHYLDMPLPLGQVVWLATANTVGSLSAPLLDRFELIEVPGYSEIEKVRILRELTWPQLLREYPITAEEVVIPDPVFAEIARRHSEPGMRGAIRGLEAIVRDAIVTLTRGAERVLVDIERARVVLDRERGLQSKSIGFHLDRRRPSADREGPISELMKLTPALGPRRPGAIVGADADVAL